MFGTWIACVSEIAGNYFSGISESARKLGESAGSEFLHVRRIPFPGQNFRVLFLYRNPEKNSDYFRRFLRDRGLPEVESQSESSIRLMGVRDRRGGKGEAPKAVLDDRRKRERRGTRGPGRGHVVARTLEEEGLESRKRRVERGGWMKSKEVV